MPPKRDSKGRFLNKRGRLLIRPPCKAPNCTKRGRYLIGSLEAQIAYKPKWGYFCSAYEGEIATKNLEIAAKASGLGMTIADYVAKRQGRRGGNG